MFIGQPEAVIDLTEYALGRVDEAMSTLDDSSGWFSQIVTELERLHHEACQVVRPEPVALARRLFAFDVDREWEPSSMAGTTAANRWSGPRLPTRA